MEFFLGICLCTISVHTILPIPTIHYYRRLVNLYVVLLSTTLPTRLPTYLPINVLFRLHGSIIKVLDPPSVY